MQRWEALKGRLCVMGWDTIYEVKRNLFLEKGQKAQKRQEGVIGKQYLETAEGRALKGLEN